MLAVAVGACSNEHTAVSTDNGFFSVNPVIDATITMGDGTVFTPDESLLPQASDLAMTLHSHDGKEMTWTRLSDFDDSESFLAGTYSIDISGRINPTAPQVAGHAQFSVSADSRTTVSPICTVPDAMLRVGVADNGGAISLQGIRTHAPGDIYATVDTGREKDIYVTAGEQSYYAVLGRGDGQTLSLALPVTSSVAAAHGAVCNFSFSDSRIVANIDGRETTVDVAPDVFDAPAPSVACKGFVPGEAIRVEEGLTLTNPVTMTVTAGRRLKSVVLTTVSPAVESFDLPGDVDLLNLSPQFKELIDQAQFKIVESEDGRSVLLDFTGLLEAMASRFSSVSTFTILAEDIAGVCSQPVTLSVQSQVMEFTVESVGEALVGINRGSVSLKCSSRDIERADFGIAVLDDAGNEVSQCPIVGWESNADGNVTITFVVPSGIKPVNVSVNYLGLRRATAVIPRGAPEFGIMVDPYATTAEVRIEAADDSVRRDVTRYAIISVDGVRAAVVRRNPDAGSIVVTGLTAERKYTVGAEIAGTVETAAFLTEKAAPVPHGAFAEWKVSIDDKNIPCGGRYSTTAISVVNRQNYADIYVQWPKKAWACNNQKTYYRSSRNRNTWYMQPTSKIVARGEGDTKAIMISSVGWDHDGEQIPDYIQHEGEELGYSKNVPHVSHRSAGRLWLGSYTYSGDGGSEEYKEGVPFASRPTSLNGYFKYIPDVTHINDRGYVLIRLVRNDGDTQTVVAEGRMEFSTTPDYRTFSVPLTYSRYGVVPTELCIMFASSTYTGDQEYEDANVPVTALPELGTMHGSTLWVSELTFSY